MQRNLAVLLLLVTLVIVSAHDLRAASLSGKVIEVNDGDVLTVLNMNRSVKVRLLGVDAPELNQAFGNTAKEHLRALVFDKFVTVEYWGLGDHNTLVGKVFVEGRDVGAQMIRDGVAWFDRNNKGPLNNNDCEVYQQSQQAAQNERRGLWESEGAVPPWQFVSDQVNQRQAVARPVESGKTSRRTQATSELTNLSLMGNSAGTPVVTGLEKRIAYNAPRKPWQRFQPAGENFSVLVPIDGKQVTEPVSSGNETVPIHTYLVRDGYALYIVLWATGPSRGERDVAAVQSSLQSVLHEMESAYAMTGVAYGCGPQKEEDISEKGFTGREIDLTDCTVPTQMRIFTRASASERQVYLGAVFYTQLDPNVRKFLDSFNVGVGGTSQSRTPRGRTTPER
jgi:endonuclease YncB( thermonuclease family)